LPRFACPHCRHEWTKPELQRRRAIPVLVDLECDGACRPRRVARAPLPEDLQRIAVIDSNSLDRWVPDTPFDEGREMWRGGHRDAGITRACDFWTRRNLAALAAVWEAIGRQPAAVQGALRFAFTASALLTSKMRRWGGSGLVTGTLYVPSLSL
jgi:hypothetical protein